MSDDVNISHPNQGGSSELASQTPVSTAHNPQELYAFADCQRVDLQNGTVLLIHRLSDAQMIVAPEVSVALASCGVFRSLPEHVEFLCSSIPQLAGQQANVTQVLDMVRDAGLLTTASATCERICPPEVPPAVDMPPTRVFVITCDRPAAVERLQASLLLAGNLTRHEQLVLVDDSRDPANAAKNRELVEDFNIRSPRDMRYVGPEEQARLLEKLVVGLPEHEEGIRFLLDRAKWADKPSYGLARTVCLLLSVGKRAIVLDDDIICAAVEAPYQDVGLNFGQVPRQADVYASEKDTIARTTRSPVDPLTAHAQCLGLTMGQTLKSVGVEALRIDELHGGNAAFLGQWSADSPVLITQCGTVGDPGTSSTAWIYELDPDSTQRVLDSPGGLEGALNNRYYWLGHSRPGFNKLAVMSQVTGLDNSALLPPYFPVFRGEDSLFGAMVEHIHPQSAVLEYDWCIPHFPIEERPGNATEPPPSGAGKLSFPKLITDSTDYDTGVSAETRLNRLALQMQALAEASDRSLLTRYRHEVAENQIKLASRLATRLQDGVARPEQWTAWLQQSLNNVSQSMGQPAAADSFAGNKAALSEEALLADFRRYAGGFAKALQAWPAMRKASRRLGM